MLDGDVLHKYRIKGSWFRFQRIHMLSVGTGLGNFMMRVDLGNQTNIDCACVYLLMDCLYVQ